MDIPKLVQYGGLLLTAGLDVYAKLAADQGKPVEQVLEEAQATWDKNRADAEALLQEGHGE